MTDRLVGGDLGATDADSFSPLQPHSSTSPGDAGHAYLSPNSTYLGNPSNGEVVGYPPPSTSYPQPPTYAATTTATGQVPMSTLVRDVRLAVVYAPRCLVASPPLMPCIA
jgi:hypothetical protein